MPKEINVKVIAPDSELEFSIQPSTTGKQLFDQVARTLGVREIWYFGISFVDTKGNTEWLKLNKKVLQHNTRKEDPLVLKLTIKFYPEDVEGELIQEITKKYFFMRVKQAILCDEIYCPSDTCVLLASYALQAKYGDYENENILREDEKILPQRVVDQHNLSTSEWREKIFMWWREHRDMLSIDAMTEHLKIVQDLEMYGVQFFDIKNKKGTQLLLGVDALGLNIYEKEDKLNPKIGFPWSEIRNISFADKKFTIKAIDRKAPDFFFYSDSMRTNKCILALCMGNHDHYMRRRKADTIEIQQMRAHAKDEKQGKLNEKRQSIKSREKKEDSDKKTAEAYEKLRVANEQCEEACRRQKQTEENMQIMHERMQEERVEHDRSVETLVSQIYVKEDNLKQLESDKYQVEHDLAMSRIEHEAKSVEEQEKSKKNRDKLEEEKKDLELKIHLASIEHQRQRDEFDNIGKEYELMKQKEVIRQVRSEEEIKVVSADMDYSENIQNDRSEENRDGYWTMGINVDKQKKLKALREDLDLHQKEGSATTTDLIHIENMKQGRDKFKTLKQIRRGNTKCRVDQFESQ